MTFIKYFKECKYNNYLEELNYVYSQGKKLLKETLIYFIRSFLFIFYPIRILVFLILMYISYKLYIKNFSKTKEQDELDRSYKIIKREFNI